MRVEDLLAEKRKTSFYIMHLSYDGEERERLWDFAREHNLIGLDYPRAVRDDWNEVREAVKTAIPPIWVKQFDMFCNEMKTGDIVLVLCGWDSLLGIAETVKSNYQYDRNLSERTIDTFSDHVRDVEWIRRYKYNNRVELPRPIRGFNNTLSRVKPRTERWQILANLDI